MRKLLKYPTNITKRYVAQYLEETGATGNLNGNIAALIRAYQVNGHHMADLDPLGLFQADLDSKPIPQLDEKKYNFSEADFSSSVKMGLPMMKGFLDPERPATTLKDLLARLKETYCSTIGVEYMHIGDRTICNWIRDRVETPQKYALSKEEKLIALERLLYADMFERIMAQKVQV